MEEAYHAPVESLELKVLVELDCKTVCVFRFQLILRRYMDIVHWILTSGLTTEMPLYRLQPVLTPSAYTLST